MAAHGMTDDARSGAGWGQDARVLTFASAAFLGLLLAILVAVSLFGHATDGEPLVTVDLNLPAPHGAIGPPRFAGTGSHAAAAISRPGTGLQGVPPGNAPQPASAPAARIDKPVFAGKALIADPALIEATPQGPLPRIADDGRTPMAAYGPAAKADGRPRIALVITGLGINARITAAAIKALPAAVTLAFASNAGDVQNWISQARAAGHEVLLEVPMEPYDFPDSDPGPHTLTVTASENSNIDRLTWALTRATGYSGVTNFLGGRFMASPDSLAPVMTFLARRGLLFFDSEQDAHSAAPDVARQLNAPYVGNSLSVDDIQSAAEIDSRLSALESRARSGASAVGVGFVYPVTVDRVSNWANGLSGRGFVLVPPSVIVARAK